MFNLPPKDSPFWTAAIIGMMVVALALMLIFNYKTVDARDPVTILVVAITGICVWVIKVMASSKPPKDNDDKPDDENE